MALRASAVCDWAGAGFGPGVHPTIVGVLCCHYLRVLLYMLSCMLVKPVAMNPVITPSCLSVVTATHHKAAGS